MSFYIGKQFILRFAVIFLILLMLILMFDTIELLRRAASKPPFMMPLVFAGLTTASISNAKGFPNAMSKVGSYCFTAVTTARLLSAISTFIFYPCVCGELTTLAAIEGVNLRPKFIYRDTVFKKASNYDLSYATLIKGLAFSRVSRDDIITSTSPVP